MGVSVAVPILPVFSLFGDADFPSKPLLNFYTSAESPALISFFYKTPCLLDCNGRSILHMAHYPCSSEA